MDKIKFLGKQRAEFSIAQKYFNFSRIIQLLILLISVIVILLKVDLITYIGSLINLILALLWQFLNYLGKNSRLIAEKARRATLLSIGLNFELERKYLRDLLIKFKSTDSLAREFEDESYFQNIDQSGYDKLTKLLEESTFWTKHLYHKCAVTFWILFTFGLIVSILGLFIIPTIFQNKESLIILTIFCLFLSWLITGDLLKSAIEFTSSSSALDDIENRITNLIATNSNNLEKHLFLILSDYNSVVQRTPLIPSFIYKKYKNELNNLWLERLN